MYLKYVNTGTICGGDGNAAQSYPKKGRSVTVWGT